MKKNKVFIIAEIGPNHNGSYKRAVRMIKLLKNSGVDAVKFQLANPDEVYSKDAFKADYQLKNTDKGSIIDMSKKNQLLRNEHLKISKLCKKMNIEYMCSAFDINSLKYLVKKIKIKKIKIPSGEIKSVDQLKYLSKLRKKIILSTGMSNINEIKSSIKILNKNFKKDITLLHCVSSYPAKKKDLNLNLINSLKKQFRLTVGYSDHSIGEEACLAAVAMGAKVIEKHITISKNMIGPDHKSSSNIKEFINLVKKIRKVETMMGIDEKKILKNELNVQSVARKSIVSKTFLKKGKFLKRSDITFKRPGTGIDPMNYKKIIGKKLRKNILGNRLILSKDII